MAILIANDGDKIVGTIADRNAITNKFNGMNVHVTDAIADVNVGTGEAGYTWSVSKNAWILAYKDSKDTLTFTKESLTIVNGQVTATNLPQDGIVWNCTITDIVLGEVVIVAEPVPNVTNYIIDIGSQSYNGLTLTFYYGYGALAAALGNITKASIGLGNVDNTSDVNKPVSITQQAALDLKEDLINKGASNGYAGLVNGKIAIETLPDAILGQVEYQGTWNPSTNTPTIPTAITGNKGWYYICTINGTTNINGITDWQTGDWLISNGTTWNKIDNTDAVSSVNGYSGAVILTKTDIGLSNATNTSDANKPVSTAQQAALDLKENTITAGTTAQYYRGDKSFQTLNKTAVGLVNVDNTSDLNKPVSTLQQAALDLKESLANKGAASGYCPLNSSSKIDTIYIPDSILGQLEYQTVWNATTNSPTIPAASAANKGYYWIVSVAGSTSISGITDWKVGDWVVSNGATFDKIDNTDSISSLNGRTGAITLDKTDVALFNVENIALTTWAGSTNITTVGDVVKAAPFNTKNSSALGSTALNYVLLSATSFVANVNIIKEYTFAVRAANGSDWTTTILHNCLGVDSSFGTPLVDTKLWWNRDLSSNVQSWGSLNNTYMSLSESSLTVPSLVTNTVIVEKAVTLAASNIAVDTAGYFYKTIAANVTFTLSGVPSSGKTAAFSLELINAGAFTITWWVGIIWAGGVAPTLTASGKDILGFITRDGGTTWLGIVTAKDARAN